MSDERVYISERKRSLKIKAVAVFIVGVCLTALVTFFIRELLNERQDKILMSQGNEYIYALTRDLEKKISLLSPVTGQVDFEEKNPSREDVLRKLETFTPLLSSLSERDGYSFLSWIPVWAGLNYDASSIVAAKNTHKQATIEFVRSHSSKWNENRSRPTTNDSLILGVNRVTEKGAVYLVVGHPFFQKFNITSQELSSAQFPLGYLLGWLDLHKLMRSSWNELHDPEMILFLTYKDNDQKNSVIYHSGVIEQVDDLPLDPEYSIAKSIDFELSGMSMQLRLVSLKQDSLGVFGNLHWLVLAIGVFSSGLWCALLLRIEVKVRTAVPTPEPVQPEPITPEPKELEQGVLSDVVRMSQARWSFIVDNLPVALFAVDNSGMFTLGEGRGLSILGLRAGEVEGNSIYEVFAEAPHLIDAFRDCLSGDEKYQTVKFNRHWVNMRLSPVVLDDGSFHGVIGVASDVSEEYQVRARLDKANMHLRGLMDNIPSGVAFIREGVVQWCSRNLEDTFGYEHEELDGRSPEILYDAVSEFKETEALVRDQLEHGEVVGMKVTFRKKDGTRFQGEMNGRFVDAKSPRAGTLWVIRDLTKSMAQERERRLSKKVFDNVAEGVMITNAKGDITGVNQAFSFITGYKEDEIIGQNPSILNSGRHDNEFFDEMWRSLNENGTWEGEIWNRRKNGEIYLEWLVITSLVDENGQVEEYVSVINDITKHRQNQEQLNYQANYDQLTGLPNKHLLADRFNQTSAWAMREDKAFSLVYMDVDHFKYLNESLGHDVGDGILKQVAERLDQALRSSDTVARVSGDEFVILLVGAEDEEGASRAVANLSRVLSDPFDIAEQDEPINLSASCGIAVFPHDGNTLAELTRKADSALYHAKEEERGTFKFFTEDMNVRAQERLTIESRMRRALENDEFELYYQPKVCANSHEIVGAEALIRWVDPDHGLVFPDRFIPIAEETGLIVPMGEWVFETACKQIKFWKENNYPIENVAVNLSGRQFSKPDLASDLKEILDRVGVEPEWIEIELTESFIASNESGAVEVLDQVSNMGLNISIDDFGTGYSSLSYLHRFPLNIMKIDRSFVVEIDDEKSEISGNLAKAVIAIAQSMKLKVVAEGVENEEQLDFLKANGCDLIQGYYFSRPLPSQEFETLLKTGFDK